MRNRGEFCDLVFGICYSVSERQTNRGSEPPNRQTRHLIIPPADTRFEPDPSGYRTVGYLLFAIRPERPGYLLFDLKAASSSASA
jgi:hypothetical protein